MTDEAKRCVKALRFKEDFECIECPIPAGNCDENCLLDVAADLIEFLSAELETQIPKWISVEERLPEESDDVLVSVGGSVGISHIVCNDMVTGEPVWAYAWFCADPEYWMTLPESPKED